MDKLELTFQVEKDTKNTRRYREEAGDGPPIIGTLYPFRLAIQPPHSTPGPRPSPTPPNKPGVPRAHCAGSLLRAAAPNHSTCWDWSPTRRSYAPR